MTRVLLGIIAVFAALVAFAAAAQENRVDIVRHDAPALAHFSEYDIGVRTLEFTDPNRVDVLNTVAGGETAYYDRSLTVEVWYPASLGDEQTAGGVYTTVTRNPAISAMLHGKAVRDAGANKTLGSLPLVIISHGYPGNRYLMSHMGENLASKGYVVAAIDHRDSTYSTQAPAASAMYNSPLDQIFVMNQLSALSVETESFLGGMVNADRTGIVGYSFGGLALVNNLGAGYSEAAVNSEFAAANRLAHRHAATNPRYHAQLDSRIRAGIAVAPWGMAAGLWEVEDIANIKVPTLFIAGSQDQTSGYETGVRLMYESATMSDRYLLTFLNAGHNAIAPIPLPLEIQLSDDKTGAYHYTDAVWDSVRSANILNHFATAFLDLHLKNDQSRQAYLDLVPNSQDGVFMLEEGQETALHTYWKGFPPYTARGLILEHSAPAE